MKVDREKELEPGGSVSGVALPGSDFTACSCQQRE